MAKKNFRTSDFGLATVLSYLFDLKKIEMKQGENDRGQGIFVFENSPELEGTIEEYWNKKIRVEPIQYNNQIKNIKNRLYDAMKMRGGE